MKPRCVVHREVRGCCGWALGAGSRSRPLVRASWRYGGMSGSPCRHFWYHPKETLHGGPAKHSVSAWAEAACWSQVAAPPKRRCGGLGRGMLVGGRRRMAGSGAEGCLWGWLWVLCLGTEPSWEVICTAACHGSAELVRLHGCSQRKLGRQRRDLWQPWRPQRQAHLSNRLQCCCSVRSPNHTVGSRASRGQATAGGQALAGRWMCRHRR